jgi:hypothetical protein
MNSLYVVHQTLEGLPQLAVVHTASAQPAWVCILSAPLLCVRAAGVLPAKLESVYRIPVLNFTLRCVDVLLHLLQEEFFLRFAEFEEMVKEHERARAIYQVGAATAAAAAELKSLWFDRGGQRVCNGLRQIPIW